MSLLPPPPEAPIIPLERNRVTVVCIHAFLAILSGLALRLLFFFQVPPLVDDSGTYLQLARNWADHHIYGLWLDGHIVPTDLRMPGYPALLAGVAMLFGRATTPIVLSQVAVDLGTCVLTALLGAILAPVASRTRVAIAAMWLAATCPFVANYSVVVLTEGLGAFLTTAALTCFAMGLRASKSSTLFILTGAFIAGLATLVRPEMPLLLVVSALVYAVRYWRLIGLRRIVLGGAVMACAFLLPLVPWAARNWITLHEFQPIAPRYVTMPGEYAPVGYYAWTRTWLVRYRDVYLNVWKIGEEPIDLDDLPASAFDSQEEKARIADLFEQYNESPDWDISPEMDQEFAEIARERTRRNPFRTYIAVPFQRGLTIWFTPRVELLPMDGKLWPIWEEWEDSPPDYLITVGFAILGYLYVASALGGIWFAWRSKRNWRTQSRSPDADTGANLWGIALVLAYLLARTAFLTTVEAPEPRYVVTCYPAVLSLVALLWARWPQRSSTGSG